MFTSLCFVRKGHLAAILKSSCLHVLGDSMPKSIKTAYFVYKHHGKAIKPTFSMYSVFEVLAGIKVGSPN